MTKLPVSSLTAGALALVLSLAMAGCESQPDAALDAGAGGQGGGGGGSGAQVVRPDALDLAGETGGAGGMGGKASGGSGGATLGEGGAGGSPSRPSSPAERRQLLASSRASWTALKSARGDNYEYMREKTVYPFGGTHQTRIEVRGGVVVRRSLGSKNAPTWVEIGTDLGTHQGGYLAPAITIDELYNRCETQILTKDESQFTLTLTTHPDGVIDLCQAWPRGCQDDCGIDYEVTSYEFLK